MHSVSSLSHKFFNAAIVETSNQNSKIAKPEVLDRVHQMRIQIPTARPVDGEVRFALSATGTPLSIKTYKFLKFFEEEYKFLQLVKEVPHCVNIRAVGELDDKQVVVLDNAGEQDLLDFITKIRKLSEREALQLAIQILECIEVLHEKKEVIHRDIKPDNIIVNSSEEGLQFTLVDFGIATENCKNPKQCQGGTSRYASPEYALSNKSSPFQDIWSLGYVIFSAFSGEPLISSFEHEHDLRLGLLQEMQMVFGKFPQSMIKTAPEHIKENYFEKKGLIKKKYVLKKAGFKCKSLEERMKEFPDPIKKLLRRIFSYENRPTASELLGLEEMKKDVCFKVEIPPQAIKMLITSCVDVDGELEIVEKEFNLWEKSFGKIHHHVPKSKDKKYKVTLMDCSGNILCNCETEIKNLQDSIVSLLSQLPSSPEIGYTSLTISSKNFVKSFSGLELIVESETQQGIIQKTFKIKKNNTFPVPTSINNKYKISFRSKLEEYIEWGVLELLPGGRYQLDIE